MRPHLYTAALNNKIKHFKLELNRKHQKLDEEETQFTIKLLLVKLKRHQLYLKN